MKYFHLKTQFLKNVAGKKIKPIFSLYLKEQKQHQKITLIIHCFD